jgi:adenylate cyclase
MPPAPLPASAPATGPAPAAAADTSNVMIDAVTDWLMAQALHEPSIEEVVRGTAARVDAAGIPLLRLHISFNLLHPLYQAMGLTWRRGAELQVDHFPYRDPAENAPWRHSPFVAMIRDGLTALRRRLVGSEAQLDFPVLKDLAAEGATDYFAFAVPFGDAAAGRGVANGLAGSWVTDRPGGFTDADIRALMRVQRRLAVACRMNIRGAVADNVVRTYLGRDAGRRVLSGQIKRGDGETLRAVIWYSDLRDSTEMSAALDRGQYIEVLNEYFACTAGIVQEAGGEILNFIGDAVLAIFPVANGAPAEATCRLALDAARAARAKLAEINRERARRGQRPLAYGLALHLGDVMFGNIGTPDRLAFSVIGPTVNEVARLESLTKSLKRGLVVSAAFAAACPAKWESLGRHEIRGVAKPIEVMTPAEDAGIGAI